MKAAALLIILLSNDGRWLSGTEGQMVMSWNTHGASVPCELIWELKLGDTHLGGDRVALGVGALPTVRITCPDVRVRAVLQWNWRLLRKQDGQEIDKGAEKIVAYPADLTAGWVDLLRGKRIVVVDKATGIPAILEHAKIKHLRLDDASKLQMAVADIVLIGPDILGEHLFEQNPLQGLLGAGVAVAVFRQTHCEHVLGLPVVHRLRPDKFVWPTEDSLFRGLNEEDIQSWERSWVLGELKELHALRLPSPEISTGLVIWPARFQDETPAVANLPPAAVDSLLVSRSGGKGGPGRLVLCQMPLGDWQSDPRSQIFLGNVLDVLISPPFPRVIPAPQSPTPAPVRPRSTITISPGDSP